MKAMVLCAGLGTRLGDLTREIPKPMLALQGRPLLAYLLGNLRRHGFDRIAINLKHQFFAAQAVRPGMRKLGGGSIVNFSSLAWIKGGPRMVAYAAAKAAVVGLTTSLARELGDENIRVNAIAPGAVMTERQRRLWVSEADMESFKAAQCLHESLTGDAIAPAVLFLASDDARMITKQCLVVDGGMH